MLTSSSLTCSMFFRAVSLCVDIVISKMVDVLGFLIPVSLCFNRHLQHGGCFSCLYPYELTSLSLRRLMFWCPCLYPNVLTSSSLTWWLFSRPVFLCVDIVISKTVNMFRPVSLCVDNVISNTVVFSCLFPSVLTSSSLTRWMF